MRGVPPGVELRRIPAGDRAALEAAAAVQDAVFPDDPVELDLLLEILDRVAWSFDVAALRDDATVGWGSCRPRVSHPASSTAFGRLAVLPAEQGSGIEPLWGPVGHLLAGLPGDGHTVVRADLADADAVRQMVDQAAADLGGLDVLVNNAGIYVRHPITEVSYEQWQDVWRDTLAANLIGAANVTWCAVQYMKQTGGRIVNVTSRGAYRGEPRHPAYGASKAGLNSFGQSMARALAPLGIAVASVAPGYVATDMVAEMPEKALDRVRGQIPLGRLGKPEEVARVVGFLAADESEYITGQIWAVNGGMDM